MIKIRQNNELLRNISRGFNKGPNDVLFNKFARGLITTTPAIIWDDGGAYVWHDTASVISCTNIDPNDVVGGSGWGIYAISGIDENGKYAEDVLVTGGDSTIKFRRVFRAVAYSVDGSASSTATNAGRINFTHKDSGDLVATINYDATWSRGEGQTLMSHCTLPDDCNFGLLTNVTITTSGTHDIELKFMYRDKGQPMRTAGRIDMNNAPVYSKVFNPFQVVSAGTDLWLEGHTQSGTTEISLQYDVIAVYD